jgi:hypothetical protein
VKEPIAEIKTLKPPGAARQVQFYQLLVAARKQWFIDALSEALASLDQGIIKKQLAEHVPPDAQKILASAGIRDEHVFPVPAVIESRPSLVGYYRLLLGIPQKSFYKGSTGMGIFKTMEERNTASARQIALFPALCRAMADPLAELVRQIPHITTRDLAELPLLTFGSQLQGSNNTKIGKKAMHDVFLAISEIVAKYIVKNARNQLTVKNTSGRDVFITLSHDPDVAIDEQVGSSRHRRVAIEVKGGTDISNAHNRAGEAEKSHAKAKSRGYTDFWTIISKTGLDMGKLKSESQTTNHWFDVAEVLGRYGQDWDEFRQRLATAVGIPI